MDLARRWAGLMSQDEEFKTSREFGEVPHHSFELEHDVLRLLHGVPTNKMNSLRAVYLQDEHSFF